jgi:hypothetical protein
MITFIIINICLLMSIVAIAITCYSINLFNENKQYKTFIEKFKNSSIEIKLTFCFNIICFILILIIDFMMFK